MKRDAFSPLRVEVKRAADLVALDTVIVPGAFDDNAVGLYVNSPLAGVNVLRQ